MFSKTVDTEPPIHHASILAKGNDLIPLCLYVQNKSGLSRFLFGHLGAGTPRLRQTDGDGLFAACNFLPAAS
jgi:hypothetical protein